MAISWWNSNAKFDSVIAILTNFSLIVLSNKFIIKDVLQKDKAMHSEASPLL